MDKSDITLEVGKTQRLTASFTPADAENTAHEWRSSNQSVAKVDETGLVTAVSPGETTIAAVALANNRIATCKVSVVEKIIYPTSVKLNKTEEYLLIGGSVKLEATVLPETSNAKSITWRSSNHEVATVEDDGTVKGINEGTAVISATTSNNKVAQCKITIGNKTVEFSDIKTEVIDDTSVKVSLNVFARGTTISELGLCYDIEKTPTTESTVIKLDVTKTEINGALKSLKPNTRYFLRAFAKDKSDIYYSATVEFSTQGIIITDFKIKAYYLNQLEFTTPRISGVDVLNVCYGIAPHPEITDNMATVAKEDDNYRITLKPLDKSTTYYLRAFTLNDGKVRYYNNEGAATTIGTSDVNIVAKKVGRSSVMSYNSPYIAKITSVLPQGTYQVSYAYIKPVDLKMGDLIGLTKTYSKEEGYKKESTLYISGGEQTFYTMHENTNDYAIPAKLNFNIEFLNIESGIKYIWISNITY
ncbi:MAG: Ig-like domain-containing protein [Clostridium sp.]|nr:Ig-like domain-containing protein [Clostridium sp.]